jgi:hypothetical protein
MSEHIGSTVVSASTVAAERRKRFSGDRGRDLVRLAGRGFFTTVVAARRANYKGENDLNGGYHGPEKRADAPDYQGGMAVPEFPWIDLALCRSNFDFHRRGQGPTRSCKWLYRTIYLMNGKAS